MDEKHELEFKNKELVENIQKTFADEKADILQKHSQQLSNLAVEKAKTKKEHLQAMEDAN